ncbi:hypothetical protein DV735_g2574, partial [Chaetothyriales sp. CBS 134920]
MAKDKDRALNPAAAQRKADKARALKKSRAQVQAQRNEKLARRNPERIQRQIDQLKQLEAGGDIKQRERDILAELERDLKAVYRAKEALAGGGQKPGPGPSASNHVLGKRTRNEEGRNPDSGSDTDESVRRIPMPEDTPPPIQRRYYNNTHPDHENNNTRQPDAAHRPQTQTKTTYSAAPQIRDLKKEAISKFVPAIVRKKLDAANKGRVASDVLLEPEEADRLEAQGYFGGSRKEKDNSNSDSNNNDNHNDVDVNVDEEELQRRRLAEEEARFERELAMVDAIAKATSQP